MNNASRSMLASLWLVSLLPAGCSSSDDKNVAPPDEQPEEMMDPPAERFLLSLGTTKLPLPQGNGDSLTVTVERQNGFEGAVAITAQGLPEGVVAAPLTIPEGETEAVLELEAEAQAPHSLPTSVTISGKSAKLHDERELTVTVCGVPGAVDTSFQGGNVMVPVGAGDAYAYAMAAQPDGKVVVVGTSHEHSGDFAIVRFERDGDLDTAFGDEGLVMTQVGNGSDIARAVAIDEQGRIVVAGTADGAHGLDFAVVRYLGNGQLDASFGKDGKALVTFGEDSDTAYALALQSDGKIVVGGDSNRGSAQSGLDFALLRLTQDGQPDDSFGEAGLTTLSVAQFGGRDSIYALALQEISGEERIVAAGGEGDFTLARFRADGRVDTTFGEQGKLSGVFGSTIGAARALTLTSDNELVAAGHAQHDFALVKLSTEGTLVSGFGKGGKLTTAVSADNWDEAQGVGVQADGKLLVAGWTYEGNSSSGNTALLRYAADGTLDESFGDAGIVVTQVAAPTKADQGSALLIQPDERVPSERLLVAGFASAGLSQFALTRFWR
ncbi:MAG TPA: hypothetical protein VHP33_09315 [Polyangiaceae bacterium]|nr:hypothetical protein [Polyangiaceae bacterium]